MKLGTFVLLVLVGGTVACFKRSSSATPESKGPHVGTVLTNQVNEITFISSNRSAELVNFKEWIVPGVYHLAQLRPEFQEGDYSRLECGSPVPSRSMQSYGFVQTVVQAYKYHHNLVLRPDDLWTAIITQFSLHVNGNSEQLRSLFVNHTGKQTLRIDMPSDLSNLQYSQVILGMKELIGEKVSGNVANWMFANFTTSTEDDYITNGFILMASMQHYFEYEIGVMCGIPKITLLGTTEDWEEIQRRIERLPNYGVNMRKWYVTLLRPILAKFVDAKKTGIIDTNFWGDICRVHDEEGNYFGYNAGYIDGWITAFTAFDVEGRWMGDIQEGDLWPKVAIERWAPGTVTVPVTIKTPTTTLQSTVFAGHMGHTISKDGLGVGAYSGWAIAIK